MPCHDLTRNQKIVLNRLIKNKKATRAYELLDQLRDQGLRAPAQIYRALEKLISLGLVHRVESLNAFVACMHDHHSTQFGFAICEECDQCFELPMADIEKCAGKWLKKSDFQLSSAMIELQGVCKKCS